MPKYIVRHGALRFLGEYTPVDTQQLWKRNDRVVVRTPRGLELGTLLCEADDRAKQFLAEPTEGQLLRRMTEND
ncbi:hypothetical protein, partial [Bacillus amyloliquefaciens]|uniref:hypothetical protein n=1 Tax=Bacillus amyloliquefaciens TaxID=1390 RepID=UPI00197A8BEE